MQAICIGGASVDRTYNLRGTIAYGTSNPAVRAKTVFGGVARNVSENLARLGIDVALASAVGTDEAGDEMMAALRAAGVNVELMKRVDGSTDEYAAILERGELVAGAADMRAAESFTIADLDAVWDEVARSEWLFVDCNLADDVLRACIERTTIANCKLAVDAVSIAKTRRLPDRLASIDLLFLNEAEAREYLQSQNVEASALAAALIERGVRSVVLSCGQRGSFCAQDDKIVSLPSRAASVVSATGAGDAAIAGTLYGRLQGRPLPEAARIGTALAALTLECEGPVRPDLSRMLLDSQLTAVAR